MCRPTRLDTILKEKLIVWNVATSRTLKKNHNDEYTMMSNIALQGPIKNMKSFNLLKENFLGCSKSSLSTLSKGNVICPKS